MSQCLVQQDLQIVNAFEFPSLGQKKSFEKPFHRLLKKESGRFRVVNIQEMFYPSKVLLSNAKLIRRVERLFTRHTGPLPFP